MPQTLAARSSTRLRALEMVVRGESLDFTLDLVASMAAEPNFACGCGVLVLRDGNLRLEGEAGLTAGDHDHLRAALAEPFRSVNLFAARVPASVRPLISGAAELLGVLLIFDHAEGNAYAGSDENGTRSQVGDHAPDWGEIDSLAGLAIEQSNLLAELRYRANHDSLTHLWNRVWLDQELLRALAAARRQNVRVGLIFLDLDRFGLINDVLGHAVGDSVLRQVADRLQKQLPPGAAIASAGGDEFMILMPEVESIEEISALGEQLLNCLDGEFLVDDHELTVNATVGISINDGESGGEDLQATAYTALRHAKKHGRNRVVAFDRPTMGISPERFELEHHLRSAIAKNDFALYYQPQIDLRSGRLCGVEALVRWKHPALGFISPSTFIPIAEEIGQIERLGVWAIDEAVRQIRSWRAAGLSRIQVAVNVSVAQFLNPEFGASVRDTLLRYDVDPQWLELEITESLLMTNFATVVEHIRMLQEIGVTFAIDDFGTGHSSLAYLQQLPIQRVKMDRLFLREVNERGDRPPLVSNIIRLAHGLGASIVSEGIETLDQLLAMTAMDCDSGQGYYFSRPIPADDFVLWEKQRMVGPDGFEPSTNGL